jgi:hypothetical protein
MKLGMVAVPTDDILQFRRVYFFTINNTHTVVVRKSEVGATLSSLNVEYQNCVW